MGTERVQTNPSKFICIVYKTASCDAVARAMVDRWQDAADRGGADQFRREAMRRSRGGVKASCDAATTEHSGWMVRTEANRNDRENTSTIFTFIFATQYRNENKNKKIEMKTNG